MDTIGRSSACVQYGVPLRNAREEILAPNASSRAALRKKLRHPDRESITDYLFRWLACEFIPGYRDAKLPRRAAGAAAEGVRGTGKESRQSPRTDLEQTGKCRARPVTGVQALSKPSRIS